MARILLADDEEDVAIIVNEYLKPHGHQVCWVEDGAANLGWALLPTGDDGWDFLSADSPVPPQLVVWYHLQPSAFLRTR